LGKGTTFCVLLPRTKDDGEKKSEVPDFVEAQGTETVLLVEDDSAVRQTLAHGLEQEGYQVYTAANGREAITQFNRHGTEISAVVTDLVMPEMGGIALGEQLREIGAAIPVLYVTGYHQDLETYPSQDLPLCGGFLLKPFNPNALAAAIRRALAGNAVTRTMAG
jgi:hypothetical protein